MGIKSSMSKTCTVFPYGYVILFHRILVVDMGDLTLIIMPIKMWKGEACELKKENLWKHVYKNTDMISKIRLRTSHWHLHSPHLPLTSHLPGSSSAICLCRPFWKGNGLYYQNNTARSRQKGSQRQTNVDTSDLSLS